MSPECCKVEISLAQCLHTETYFPITESDVRDFGQWIIRQPWAEVAGTKEAADKQTIHQDITLEAYVKLPPAAEVYYREFTQLKPVTSPLASKY